MYLVVDNFGAFVKKKSNRFLVSYGDKSEEFCADDVSQILILKGSAISTDSMALAAEKGIDIVIVDNVGRPLARIYPCRLGGTTLTRRRQLEAYFSNKGMFIVKAFLKAKIENQSYLLRALGKSRENKELEEKAKYVSGMITKIENIKGKRIDDVREKLLGIEGEASRVYFQALGSILPSSLYSGARVKRPPGDAFNALLGYGYGILYSEVEKACIISGLDPYLGFLHTDRYGKPSMALDLIEEFRQPVIDRAMITLIQRKMIDEKDIEKEGNGVYLNKNGRSKAIEAVVERFNTAISYKKEKITLLDIILKQARSLVKFLNENEKYEPFIYKW
jgi:CRISPR-associated protein Cas1